MRAAGASPIRLVVVSFVAVIAAGTVLLKLPIATPPAQPIGWIDALFTATSATCVTGLVVRDTGSGFTGFGQAVILLLIQTGGLGVMTFSLLVLSLLRAPVPMVQRVIYERTLAGFPSAGLWPLVRLVFVFTFLAEAAGAGSLFVRLLPEVGVRQAAWPALFHSVSAFCNAGFALWPDSLVRFGGDVWVNGTVMALVVLGGLGFIVVFDLLDTSVRPRRLAVHTKLALVVTAVLTLAGAALFWGLEGPRTLFALPLRDQALISLFQSVTTRTAGFNTVDVSLLAPATLFVMLLLMFVGGAPGSCAGGIKTTTLGVLVASTRARLRGHEHVNLFGRTLSRETVGNALAIALGGAAMGVAGLFLLLLAESPAAVASAEGPLFISYLFETVSALGTVGLSTGITPWLEPESRIVVALLMFVGRLGPLTVAAALARPDRRTDWRYPREEVMVG